MLELGVLQPLDASYVGGDFGGIGQAVLGP